MDIRVQRDPDAMVVMAVAAQQQACNLLPGNKDRSAAGIGFAQIAPRVLKAALERIAVDDLERAAAEDGKDAARSQELFGWFADAVVRARDAGPISKRTLARIRDVAGRHAASTSLLRLAINSFAENKVAVLEVLLDAGLSPDFRALPGDQAPLLLAALRRDAQLMRLLIARGAMPFLEREQVLAAAGVDGAPVGGDGPLMRAWDAFQFLERAAGAAPRPRAG